ncbi:MAG: FecR domain-containing protein [Bacteroidaceae bacterium]|nr:FecR domain-containing protein [Bacteroidaceae bacterium]
MNDSDKMKDDGMEKALSMMEHPEEYTEDEILEIMEDEECMQVCQDILDCRLAMQQEHLSYKPDVEAEWGKFRQKHSRRSNRYWVTMGVAIGMAASFLLVLAFSWVTGFGGWPKDTVVYFTAVDGSSQDITLQTTSGVHVSLDKQSVREELDEVGAVLVQTDSVRLEYTEFVEKVETHLLSTPRGKTFEVVLADGSKIWLNADSRLEYPSRFVGDRRVVKLHGEAYFQIAKDENRPFIVETDGLQTVVLGTEFNVRNYKKENSHVTLIKGSVKVNNTANEHSVVLVPGENARVLEDGSLGIQEVDVDTYIYWRDGYFYFDNRTLADIMQEIGRWYNVNVVFDDARVMNYKLRYFCKRDEGIEKAVERLQCLKKAQVSLDGNTVYIK